MRETFQREKNHQRFDLPSFHFSSSIVFYEKFFSLCSFLVLGVLVLLFLRMRQKKRGRAPLKKEIMGLFTLPRLLRGDDDDGSSNRGVSTLEDDNRENDDEEQRLMSSSSMRTSSSWSSRKRSGVFQFAIFGCAFLFFALGYVSSPTTPILSSQTSSSSPSSLNSRRGASFSVPSLGSSSSQKSGRHRFELLGGGGGKKREDEEKEDKEEDRGEAKETNALDAELELEKDEHLLEHLQKSLNDNIETQEKETLKLVEMKVDEQDAEKMQEEEELIEEELGIHHNSHGEDEASNTGSIDKSSSKNIKDDGSELGFKEEDNESGMKNATSRKTTTTTFEDSLLTNVSSELDEVIRDGKQSMIDGRDVTPRAAAFERMDDELKDVLDAVHAVDGSGGENSENQRNNVKLAREKVLSSSSSSSSSFDRGDRKITTPKDNPEETLGWTEVDATTIDPESITESAQSGVRSLVLNPEIVHELKEKFEDMKNKGEVQVEGNWKKFDAEAKEEKKQMKEAKKMEEIVEESSKILDDIDAVRMAQSLDAGGGSKSFSWTFSYLYFPLIVFFSVLLAVIALLIKTSDKNKLKRYGSTGSFDRSSPKGKSRLYTLGEEEEIYQTTKDNTYPDFSNLRDFEKGNRIYNSSIESFDDDYEDDDYDDDSLDDEEDGSCEDDFDEEALSERSSDVSSFQGFREKAIAVAKAAEGFLANGKGATVRVSNAGTFHGASKYGANENGRDEKDDVGVTSLKKKESHNNNENGQKSSFIKSSTTKWI